MLRKRLVFSLIYENSTFTQSRNFRLQKVGGVSWLERNYHFQKISFSLDEIVIIDASKKQKDTLTFAKVVSQVVAGVFVPVAAGGGIRNMEDAELLFKSGADKIVLNTMLLDSPDIVGQLVSQYGSQSIVASVDYRRTSSGPIAYVENGEREVACSLGEYLHRIQSLGVGEILLNSIDQDGTGFGLDFDTIDEYGEYISVPLIVMGGAGNERHLNRAIAHPFVSAVATANIFNFVGDGLPNARAYMVDQGCNLARWNDADR